MLALASQAAQAQYTGLPTYSQTPVTQLGSVNSGTNFLTLGSGNAAVGVTGKFAVNLNAGPSSGTLVRWVVDRPLAAGQWLFNAMTTTLLDGFSLPPAGTAANSGGAVRTFITDLNQPVFDLDGVYLSGPGGTWVVDVPVLSGVAAVPEPASAALLLLGSGVLLLRAMRHKEKQ